ncbi:hypothetical protein ABEB36_009458 [Hypothenemus hampei]|uniref:Uncharacterized protein n=1 Tax=Hypothenemus hampei TaxID=57062 RepID=A0ABD1EGI0_HYPHA
MQNMETDAIHTVAEQDKLISEHSIKYLDQLTKFNMLNNPTLKSLYRTRSRLMELRHHVFLPEKNINSRCQRCFLNFSEGMTKYEIQPAQINRFTRAIFKKVETNVKLTKFQRLYYKKTKNKFPRGIQNQNKLISMCQFCHKKTELFINKPNRKVVPTTKKLIKPKKKQKKKDKFCGLNPNAVLQTITTKLKGVQSKPINSNKNVLKLNSQDENKSIAARGFQTSNIISLNSRSKKRKIKICEKGNKIALPSAPPKMTKAKEKLQKKNLNNLTNILKQANVKSNMGQNSKLVAFLNIL